jgi:hypothetical protein
MLTGIICCCKQQAHHQLPLLLLLVLLLLKPQHVAKSDCTTGLLVTGGRCLATAALLHKLPAAARLALITLSSSIASRAMMDV